ncbi:high-affinity iron permease [Dissophora ornata]|nr:high-affinity iron permease [Dissophora ornata]KAI8604803.1 high-affinity iron permease [Dissophora ornata]
MGATDYFSIPIFFIIFRETTEAAIIVSVLLSFLSQVMTDDMSIKRRLARQVWAGTALGLFISLAIGAAFIVIWNKYANDLWANSEQLWEGSFSLIAVVMITVMGVAMLRTTQIQEKWKGKLAKAMEDETQRGLGNSSRRYALFILPLITVLREGLEAIVFIGGITFSEQARAIPAAVIVGVFCGLLVGYIIYRGGNMMKLHKFFVASTCLLLIIAAGLVAKAVAAFEANTWNKLTNTQSDDAGTFDPRVNVWGLTCCNPNDPNAGGWALFNAVLGWNNVASIGTIVSYILYWFFVIGALVFMKLRRNKLARQNRFVGEMDSENSAPLPDEKQKTQFLVDEENVRVEEATGEPEILHL